MLSLQRKRVLKTLTRRLRTAFLVQTPVATKKKKTKKATDKKKVAAKPKPRPITSVAGSAGGFITGFGANTGGNI